ncbi:MAG: hypothetical protein HYT87_12475 [Nitrospirae bacterium]|nr:hypothetical protein [Nitrospirota bacterium]
MLDLNLHLFLTQSLPAAVLFLLLMFLLRRLLFTPALHALHKQDDALSTLRRQAEESRQTALRLQEEMQGAWSRAKAEASQAREKRLIEAGTQAEAVIETAKEQVKAITVEAHDRAERESAGIRSSLMPQVDSWVGRVIERLLNP